MGIPSMAPRISFAIERGVLEPAKPRRPMTWRERRVLISLECTIAWLEAGRNEEEAIRELAYCCDVLKGYR